MEDVLRISWKPTDVSVVAQPAKHLLNEILIERSPIRISSGVENSGDSPINVTSNARQRRESGKEVFVEMNSKIFISFKKVEQDKKRRELLTSTNHMCDSI